MNYRTMPDGKLVAPRRGRPPAAPAGYEPDPGDAYVFLPILEPCEHRTTEIKHSGCCDKVFRHCSIIDADIQRQTCVNCKGNPEWIKEHTES